MKLPTRNLTYGPSHPVMLLKDGLCVIWKRSAHLEPNIWSLTFVQTCTYALACYGSLDSSLMVCNVWYVWII